MNWSLKVDAVKTIQNEHNGNPCTEKNNDFETGFAQKLFANITNNHEEMAINTLK